MLYKSRFSNNGDSLTHRERIVYAGVEKTFNGVGLIMSQDRRGGYCQLSDRICIVKSNVKLLYISILVLYTPTTQTTEEEFKKDLL